jgi:hypothetical protein
MPIVLSIKASLYMPVIMDMYIPLSTLKVLPNYVPFHAACNTAYQDGFIHADNTGYIDVSAPGKGLLEGVP